MKMMTDFIPLYRQSFAESQRLNERCYWQESFEENIRCRDFTDRLVRENFDGYRLKGEIPQKTVVGRVRLRPHHVGACQSHPIS
jgi:hypothetical protein